MRSPEGGYSEKHLPLPRVAAYTLTARDRDPSVERRADRGRRRERRPRPRQRPRRRTAAPAPRRYGTPTTCRSRPPRSSRRATTTPSTSTSSRQASTAPGRRPPVRRPPPVEDEHLRATTRPTGTTLRRPPHSATGVGRLSSIPSSRRFCTPRRVESARVPRCASSAAQGPPVGGQLRPHRPDDSAARHRRPTLAPYLIRRRRGRTGRAVRGVRPAATRRSTAVPRRVQARVTSETPTRTPHAVRRRPRRRAAAPARRSSPTTSQQPTSRGARGGPPPRRPRARAPGAAGRTCSRRSPVRRRTTSSSDEPCAVTRLRTRQDAPRRWGRPALVHRTSRRLRAWVEPARRSLPQPRRTRTSSVSRTARVDARASRSTELHRRSAADQLRSPPARPGHARSGSAEPCCTSAKDSFQSP